jgi:dienelactone hydrolase
MVHKNFSLTNPSSEIIRAEIHYREGIKQAPIIVICHGFKGFKDWAFFPFLADSLAHAGYVTLTFNFSRNGIGSDLDNFTEFELFEKNTYSHELDDLQCIINAIVKNNIGRGLVDPERIGLFGHSRGGGISILHASQDDRVKALVTWSAISHIDRFPDDVKEKWAKDGFIEIENKRTLQILRLGVNLLNDIRDNASRLDILAASNKLAIPTLILHGDRDESVPVAEAHAIYDQIMTDEKELILIEGGSHTYGAQHPMTSMTGPLENAFDLTENWFDRFL